MREHTPMTPSSGAQVVANAARASSLPATSSC